MRLWLSWEGQVRREKAFAGTASAGRRWAGGREELCWVLVLRDEESESDPRLPKEKHHPTSFGWDQALQTWAASSPRFCRLLL